MAMKWISINDKKQPPFGEKLLVFNDAGSWYESQLKKVEETESGKMYTFQIDGLPDIMNVTHWMIPEPPKNNQ